MNSGPAPLIVDGGSIKTAEYMLGLAKNRSYTGGKVSPDLWDPLHNASGAERCGQGGSPQHLARRLHVPCITSGPAGTSLMAARSPLSDSHR